MSNEEILLNAILSGTHVENVPIISRVDEYLQACCLKTGCKDLPAPISRADVLLYQLSAKMKQTSDRLLSLVDGTATDIAADDLQGLTAIRDGAFEYFYALKSIEIPGTVTSIGVAAFSSCYYLENVTIPAGVASLPVNMFYSAGTGGDGVTIKILRETPPEKDATTFQNAVIASIKVPAASVAAYKAAWADYESYIEAI